VKARVALILALVLAVLLMTPLAAEAQPAGKVPRVGPLRRDRACARGPYVRCRKRFSTLAPRMESPNSYCGRETLDRTQDGDNAARIP